MEHIKEFGTCINYRNLIKIYDEYKGDNLSIINKLEQLETEVNLFLL